MISVVFFCLVCTQLRLGFNFSLVAVISVPIRGVSGSLMVRKGGKRSGNERNGSTIIMVRPTNRPNPTNDFAVC